MNAPTQGTAKTNGEIANGTTKIARRATSGSNDPSAEDDPRRTRESHMPQRPALRAWLCRSPAAVTAFAEGAGAVLGGFGRSARLGRNLRQGGRTSRSFDRRTQRHRAVPCVVGRRLRRAVVQEESVCRLGRMTAGKQAQRQRHPSRGQRPKRLAASDRPVRAISDAHRTTQPGPFR